MNLDWDYIIRNYREIHRTCLTDGYLLPFVLSPAFIPPDNRLSYDEMKKIDIDTEKLSVKIARRHEIEKSVCLGICDTYNDIEEYWTDHMKWFVKEYRQFRQVLKE